jgi:hypothetical protein
MELFIAFLWMAGALLAGFIFWAGGAFLGAALVPHRDMGLVLGAFVGWVLAVAAVAVGTVEFLIHAITFAQAAL